jgi:hypothetical protein
MCTPEKSYQINFRNICEAGYFFFGSFFFDSKRKNALRPEQSLQGE